MTPAEYEKALAKYFESLGYLVVLTSISNDFGVDLFATRGNSKLAIQAKMYGRGKRPVNRAMIFELYGAAEFFDCDAAVLATNGRLLESAEDAAVKLGVELFYFDPAGTDSNTTKSARHKSGPAAITAPKDRERFDELWSDYIMPLKGRSIEYDGGKSNKIIDVDWSGLTRVSSKRGTPQTIGIEIFRRAVGELLARGEVSRDWINAEYPGRGSSIVVRTLAVVPEFEFLRSPIRLVYRAG